MKIRLVFLTLCAVGLWLTTTGMAAPGVSPDLMDPTTLMKLGETGGPTLAIVLSMYWLRDSYQRRVEESQRYSDALLTLKKEHREELTRLNDRSMAEANRYTSGLEAVLNRSLQIPRKEVTGDE